MPYRAWLLAVVLAAFAASAVAPYDRRDWVLEHLATMALLAFLVWYERRRGGAPLSDTSYTLLAVFVLLHVVGAHYLYSRVPYDDWCERLFGARPSAWLGASRNHYDRFVHLCFGLLLLRPVAELVHRHVTSSRAWTVVVAVGFVGVISKLYELIEWGIAVVLSPQSADAYNGQQGDAFDAQKDLAFAFAGSLVGAVLVWRALGRRDLAAAARVPQRAGQRSPA